MATTKTSTSDDTVTARVIVTPGSEGTDQNGDHSDPVNATQAMDRAEYARRLAAGASPVNDAVLARQPEATVAITDPLPHTAPAPGVVEVADSLADKADGDAVVEVKPPAAPKARKTARKAKR